MKNCNRWNWEENGKINEMEYVIESVRRVKLIDMQSNNSNDVHRD